MAYKQKAWVRDDGQHYVRMWWHREDGSTAIADRPTYPDHPVHITRPEPKTKEKPPIPPPLTPATDWPADHPLIPPLLARRHALAVKHGWRARWTYACGPRVDQYGNVTDPEHHSLALRCFRGEGEVVVLIWEWKHEREGTVKGQKVIHEAGWVPEKDGSYDAPWHPVSISKAEERLKA